GDLLCLADVDLQRRHPGLPERGRSAVRSLRLCPARADLDGHDGGGLAPRSPRENRADRGESPARRGARRLMRWVRLGLLLCGTALFLRLLLHVGPRAVLRAFPALSRALRIIFIYPS